MELIAVFSPLAGFLIAGLFGRYIGDRASQFVTCASVISAAVASLVLFFSVIMQNEPYVRYLAPWINAGDFNSYWALKIDQLSVVMMCVVNIVSSCVHVYSIGYMANDPHKSRFFAYLSLFTFAMLMLVTADNLLQLFFGWEAVGLTSYLLIGFWNHKKTANTAAIKAFVMNRIGDFGFILGIVTIFMMFGTLSFDIVFSSVQEKSSQMYNLFGHQVPALDVIGLLLFVGAVGKSAQLGLHTWLPDAMEGPTPVSALIHAATMVTAGVFLVVRFSPLYEYAPIARDVICVIGALTAFIAATIALNQKDIKRIIAYSTMSQLGYMFMAVGVSAYGAAIFHLTTHAFFKALLFLGAGSVIHAMSNEQDIRKMGGIWKNIPVTYAMMWIGSLALGGVPFLSGYYSKDMILEASWADHTGIGIFAYVMGVAVAIMTGFYSWRLLLRTFHGSQNADDKVMAHVHESPRTMIYTLAVLAVFSIVSGHALYDSFVGTQKPMLLYDTDGIKLLGGINKDIFWGDSIFVLPENDSIEKAHHVSYWIKYSPVAASLLGVLIACILFYPARSFWRKAKGYPVISHIKYLFNRKWFFDRLYRVIFVKGTRLTGRFLAINTEKDFIDRYGIDGMSKLAMALGVRFSKFHTGYMYHYVFVMVVGLFFLLTWFLLRNGSGL